MKHFTEKSSRIAKFIIMELEVQDVVPAPIYSLYWISLNKFQITQILCSGGLFGEVSQKFPEILNSIKGFSQVKVDDDEKPIREIKIIGAEHKKLTKPKVSERQG